jgi:hypothetical protein
MVVRNVVTAGRVGDKSRVSGQLTQLLDPTVALSPHVVPLFRRCAGRLNSLPGSDHNERTITEWRWIHFPKLRSAAGSVAERSIEFPDRHPTVDLRIEHHIIFIGRIDQ